MEASLILWTSAQLEAIRQSVNAENFEVVHTDLRDAFHPLQELLEKVHGEVLIVDCSGVQTPQDLLALESFSNDHQDVVIFMLNSAYEVSTLKAAMKVGVREVFASPPNAGDFSASLKRLLLRKKNTPSTDEKHAKVVSFLSCKGGSGATFLATNFAYILAQELGKNTAFIDLDLQCGDAVYYVSQGPGKSSVIDITEQIDRLDATLLSSSMLHITDKFDLLSAPEEPVSSDTINVNQIERLIEVAKKCYDVLVLDLDRIVTPSTLKALNMSDHVFIVMENLLPFVRDAKRVIAKFRAMGYDERKLKLVVNRYERNGTIDIKEIEKAVGIKVSYTISSSFRDVAQAINTGTPLLHVNTENFIVDALRRMAQEFTGTKSVKRSDWFSRLMHS